MSSNYKNSSPVRNQSVIEQPDSHNLQHTSQHDLYVATHLDGFQQQNRRRGRFSTVARKHHKSYVLKGIGLDSELEDCKVAQIVVDTEQAEKIDAGITWPEGISCRPWIQRKEYVRRFRHETNHSSSFAK
ncbi:hypothetical protein DPMN_086789 [Dreissena polymorpha]|uniref:Uncharacterized protein n=1 Tax=Dreissena polymorpha TaxID=45954 RepID=A0A9D4QWA5_DREPO|nr:hypothetical protein DPMN_086789 [Dreissena polymorpha]